MRSYDIVLFRESWQKKSVHFSMDAGLFCLCLFFPSIFHLCLVESMEAEPMDVEACLHVLIDLAPRQVQWVICHLWRISASHVGGVGHAGLGNMASCATLPHVFLLGFPFCCKTSIIRFGLERPSSPSPSPSCCPLCPCRSCRSYSNCAWSMSPSLQLPAAQDWSSWPELYRFCVFITW